MSHVHGQNTKIEDVLTAVCQPKQTALPIRNAICGQSRWSANTKQSQRTPKSGQRLTTRQQERGTEILNLFHGGRSSSSSGSFGPGGGGGGEGGGGGPRAPRRIPEEHYIRDDPQQPEKRGGAIAIPDRKKKTKANPPDVPIVDPDRERQAKRKPEIPREAPDERVNKLGRQLFKIPTRHTFGKDSKRCRKHGTPARTSLTLGNRLFCLLSTCLLQLHGLQCARARGDDWQTTTESGREPSGSTT